MAVGVACELHFPRKQTAEGEKITAREEEEDIPKRSLGHGERRRRREKEAIVRPLSVEDSVVQ